MKIKIDELKKLFWYNADTGFVINRVTRSSSAVAGSRAGFCTGHGYRDICVHGRNYREHHIAWALHHGVWPNSIDHMNGDGTDNRISNLREVTQRVNTQNMEAHRNGKLVGTRLRKDANRRRPWYSTIRVGPQRVYLGSFVTEQEAHDAYVAACSELIGG